MGSEPNKTLWTTGNVALNGLDEKQDAEIF